MRIKKPGGGTPTERLLSTLCDKTFLKLWSWPNPRKGDGKELCDLIAMFDDHVFIFFDRDSKVLQNSRQDVSVTWARWKKEAIDKQIKTANGAARYIRDGRPIFLDERRMQSFPGTIPTNPIVHKIVVAHGAAEACKSFSKDNVHGSLAIAYARDTDAISAPFHIQIDRSDPVHVLDSVNLGVVLGELDTFYDLVAYITEKEKAIARHDILLYCGEEDLIAHYFRNHDSRRNQYCIGVDDQSVNALMIEEGEWKGFVDGGYQQRRRSENRDSYLWDELIQRTYQNVLDGTAGGASLWDGKDALHEMAREPRLARRALSGRMLESIRSFPPTNHGIVRTVAYMPSLSDQRKMYVFLQLRCHIGSFDECRQLRQHMLEIACGVVKNRFSQLRMVVGIAMAPPIHVEHNAEDFILLECEDWSNEQRAYYDGENEKLGFFKNANKFERRIADFE